MSEDRCEPCQELAWVLFAYQETREDTRQRAREHARACPQCQELSEAELYLRALLREYSASATPAPSPQLRSRVVARVRATHLQVRTLGSGAPNKSGPDGPAN